MVKKKSVKKKSGVVRSITGGSGNRVLMEFDLTAAQADAIYEEARRRAKARGDNAVNPSEVVREFLDYAFKLTKKR